MEKNKPTPEEILKDHLSKNLWIFISTYPVAYKADEMLIDWVVEAMQEYAELFHKEKLKEELILFRNYFNNECYGSIEEWIIDEYLKQKE